jgi:FtsZ-binding cell division protein ZapB
MSFWELHNHIEAVTKTIPLLDPESKEIVIADLAALASSRSIKFDELYVTFKNLDKEIKSLKEDEAEITKERRSKQSQLDELKVSIRQIRRSLPEGKEYNSLSGKFSQFIVAPVTPGQPYALKVIATKDYSEFSKEDQEKFFIQKEVTITEKVVLTSISGKEIKTTSSEPKITSQIILHEDAVINAYQAKEQLPHGIRVIQNYRIRTKRISKDMDLATSKYTANFLREPSSTN